MPLGTITIMNSRQTIDGGLELLLQFAGDDAYPAGGTPDFNVAVRDAIKAAALAAVDANVRGRESVSVLYVVPQDCGQYVPSYTYSADKLFVRDGGNATWAEAAGDLSTTTFNVVACCK